MLSTMPTANRDIKINVEGSSFEKEEGAIEANNDTQSDNLTHIVEGGNERIEIGCRYSISLKAANILNTHAL